MRTSPPAHYVAHNKVTRVPRSYIYLDSEARRREVGNGEVQTFRLACATHDQRRRDNRGYREAVSATFRSPAELWAWVAGRCPPRARTVLVAHNLAYDLRITDGLRALPALGWKPLDIRLDRGSTYVKFKDGDRSLVCVDSLSWVPVSLAKLGEMIGVRKLDLPAWDDSDAAWEARCVRDVEILGEVWRRLMAWIVEADLGNWKPTGAGQAWAAYRHRFMSDRLLAHDDEVVRAVERRAAWTGRCEVWRHGVGRGGPFTEWDYSAAYANVGASCAVPIKLVGTSSTAGLAELDRLSERYAVLAEVEVTTDVPTVPATVDGRIAWPVGTFTTTLWENEVRHARDNGATIRVSRLWWYKRAPALADFCRWVLEHDQRRHRALDPVVVCAAKHWGRALVGRFGSRWSDWSPVGVAPVPGLHLSTVIDRARGERWEMLTVGDECRRRSAPYDSPDAVVSVMSWIMAECRVRLWKACEVAGLDNVLYVDTDGMIVNLAGSERLAEARLAGLRVKAEYAGVEMLAPRQIKLSGRLRAAGIPRDAVPVGNGVYEGEVWSEMSSSIRSGRPNEVEVAMRRFRVTGRDERRDHLPGGSTAPRRLEVV